MKDNKVWYVNEDGYDNGFHTYVAHVFETKIEAEKYARMIFPEENEDERYARIYYKEVVSFKEL